MLSSTSMSRDHDQTLDDTAERECRRSLRRVQSADPQIGSSGMKLPVDISESSVLRTAPHDANVVATVKVPAWAIPKRVSLPSMLKLREIRINAASIGRGET